MTSNGLFTTSNTTNERVSERGGIISNLVRNFARIEVIHDKVFFTFLTAFLARTTDSSEFTERVNEKKIISK